jgi:uncharacterized protein HemX
MDIESGSIAVAILSALILGFGLWIIHKITNI